MRLHLFFLIGALCAAGCNGNPSPGDASYKTGTLDQGGFLFGCSDGVACNRFSTGYAKDFPTDGVALGSTFQIYFVPNDAQQGPAALSTPDDAKDITIRGVSPFFSSGPEGILAQDREGYGSIIAQHGNGTVIDFIALRVVKPASLTVYTASTTGNDAIDVGSRITLAMGVPQQFRTVAKDAGNNVLAGSIRADWEPTDATAFSVSVSDGVATLQALRPGASAAVSVTGGTFTRIIPVQVEAAQ